MKNESGFSRVTRDILDLCELQMQLLAVDSQEAKRKAVRAAGMVITAITLAGSALTTAMVGTGFLVNELFGLSIGTSLLVVSGVIVGFCLILLVIALKAVQAAGSAMEETKSEFAENLRWIKAVLISPEASARNRIRAESFPVSEDASTASSSLPTRSDEPISGNQSDNRHANNHFPRG